MIIILLSKFFDNFATPKAWIFSWFVVIFIVFNVADGISEAKLVKEANKNAEIFHGAWKNSDEKVGIRALDDSGKALIDESNSGNFMIVIYHEDKSNSVGMVNSKDKEITFTLESGEKETAEYKVKGLFSKKIVIKYPDGEKVTYKKKSSKWDKYVE